MLPLHIFEERYRLLVREAREFGVLLIREGSEVGSGRGDDVHEVGTLAALQEVEALPDGRYFVLVRGVRRIRLLELVRDRPYLMGRVMPLADPPARAHPRLLGLLERYLSAHGLEVAPQLSSEVGKRAVWLVGSVLRTDPAKRQRLLEEGDAAFAEQLLREELGLLERYLAVAPPRQPPPN